MSHSEIIDEMIAETESVALKYLSRAGNLKRMILKATSYPVFAMPALIVSKRKNKWIALFAASAKRAHKKIGAKLVCTADFGKGVYAFQLGAPFSQDPKEKSLYIFTPHFFSRYKTRTKISDLIGGINLTGMELRAVFFLINYSMNLDFQHDTEERKVEPGRKVFGTTAQGVALGIIESPYSVTFKTFITWDMLYREQAPLFIEKEMQRISLEA